MFKHHVKAALLSFPYGTQVYYALPYAMRLRRAKKGIVATSKSGVKGVVLEFTTNCNNRCVYCGRAEALRSGRRVIGDGDIETLKQIFSSIREIAPFESVSIGGLGEQVLYRRFPEIMNYLYEHYSDVPLNIDSNFSMLNLDRAKALVGRLDNITFSLNVPEPKLYPKVEGSYLINQAIDNLKQLMRLKQEACTDKPRVVVQVFQGYEKRYGWLLGQLKPFECGKHYSVYFKPINNFFGTLKPITKKTVEPLTTCFSILNTLNVTKEGDLFACCSGYYYGADSDTYIGNALTDTSEALKQRLAEIITVHRDKGISAFKDCKGCDVHYTMTAKNLKRKL